ncbi:2-Cys peroxiredoxin [Floricoccus tropicus]|uniref:2-Cys peroxiredoxin n=1 Tax=Floricoccus tropicus TaxID=1859473 RepID=A0A1E8GJ44_9LACT|nr:peroxiredoxin [Floricoccus tropicus]OFI48274.1 2-Cys peroxiredoxin [Floricoccus tropicus]
MKVITRNGEEVARIEPIMEGKAPNFSLEDQKGNTITLSELDKPIVLSIFPDINTRVCALQTRHFNEEAAKNPEIEFLSISNNTSDEQKNWCAAEGVDMEVLSDETNTFGQEYGLLMQTGKLARSVYLIKDGEIVYVEVVDEMTDEPNYSLLFDAIDKIITK